MIMNILLTILSICAIIMAVIERINYGSANAFLVFGSIFGMMYLAFEGTHLMIDRKR